MNPVRVLARAEMLDGLRNRRNLAVRAATPLVLLGLLAGLGLVAFGVDTDPIDGYVVAVEGDWRAAPDVLAAVATFDGGRLELEATDDAALAVLRGADAGVVLPEPAPTDPEVERRFVVVGDVTSASSRAAVGAVNASIVGVALELPTHVTLASLDVTDTPEDTAETLVTALAPAAAALVLVQGVGLMGTSAGRAAGRRAIDTLATQLPLPLPRRTLVAGRALAELTVGLLVSLPLLALLGLLTGVSLLVAGRGAWVVPSLLAIGIGTVLVALPLIGAGLLIGVRARSAQQVSAATAGGFVLTIIAVQLTVVDQFTLGPLAALAPLVGPAMVVRLTVEGTAAPVEMLLALIGTAAWTAATLLAATAALRSDRVVLRA